MIELILPVLLLPFPMYILYTMFNGKWGTGRPACFGQFRKPTVYCHWDCPVGFECMMNYIELLERSKMEDHVLD